jgi:hypothetical protein
MRLLKTGLLVITLFAACIARAQSLDEIIAKHIEAIGGADNWKKVNSIHQEGTINVQGNDVTVGLTVLDGKGFRQDISVAGMSGFQIVTPTAGWSYMPFQGQKEVEAMTEEDVKESQDELDATGDLVDYKEKGNTVELIGNEDVDGTDCYKIKVTSKQGKIKTYFIDPKSGYLIRSINKVKANGQEFDQVTNFSNYKKLPEGIVLPMNIALPFGELVVTKVEINKPVDESIFKPNN